MAEALPVEDEALSLPFKKRKMELEMARLVAEVQAIQAASRAAELANLTTEREHLKMDAEIEAKRIESRAAERDSVREHIKDVTVNYNGLCENKVMDERARLILKDSFLNLAMLGESKPVSDGQAIPPPNGKPISLSMVADQLGMKIQSNELISIGQELKKRYVEKYGKAPSKHEQLCGGRATLVNTYMEGDRTLLEDVLKWHVAGRP